MAEERILDDDIYKNKKYKIRKNEYGEDELYADDGEDETEGAVLYEVPEFEEDDEEAAILTPEQLAAREDERRRTEEMNRRFAQERLKKAQEYYDGGDYAAALSELSAAESKDGKFGDIYVLKLKALTRGFTDFSAAADCAACSEGIRRYSSAEGKKELKALSDPLKKRIEKMEEEGAALHVEVESKKAERRETFVKDRAKSVKLFSLTAVPFLACLIAAIAFGSVMFAKQNGINLILAAVFAALALVLLIVCVAAGRKMWKAMQRCSLNEKNSSTRLGREYEELLSDIKKLKDVLTSFGGEE